MTTTRFLILVLLLLLSWRDPAAAQQVAATDVRKAVEECIKAETTAERREKLYQYLLGARPADVVAAIKGAFKKKPLTEPALELAVRLHLRSLCALALPCLDKHPEHVAALALMSGEPEAVSTVFRNWFKADPAEAIYKAIHAAFLKHGVEATVIEEIRKVCIAKDTEAALCKDLLGVLKFQLGMPDLTMKQVTDEWAKLSDGLAQQAVRQPQEGIDLVAHGAMKLERTVRRGPNLRINEGGKVFFETLPEGMRDVSIRLSASVFIETEEPTAYVHLTVPMGEETGYVGTVIRGDKWSVTATYDTLTIKPRKWVRVVFDIVYRPQQLKPFLSMKVDQATAFKNIHFDEYKVRGMAIGSHLGTMLVSAIGWEKI